MYSIFKVAVVGCMLFPVSVMIAQTVTIRDQETGEPVELATLISRNSPVILVTDVKGQADISDFIGAERIEIRTFGYQTKSRSFAELEQNAFQVALKPASILLDDVIVSASRWSQLSRDVPAKVISISARETNLQNPQTAADLLAVSGKVFIQKSQQGGGSPMIRGFSSSRLLYTVDGVRMNTAIFRGGNIQNVISLDPFALEKTEVLFGPGSVIYGSDAIGGVMSFKTLTPRLSSTGKPLMHGKAVVRYASANNEKTGHFDIGSGWEKWAFITSFSVNDFGDLQMGSYGPEDYLRPFYVQRMDGIDRIITNENPKLQRPSGYSQVNMMQKIRFKPGDNWDLQYGFHYSETSAYSRYDRHIRYKNGLPRYGEWSYGPQKWMMNLLSINHQAGHFMYDHMTLRLAHQFFEESRISRDINQPERQFREEKVNAWSANFDFTKSTAAGHKLFYGMELVGNTVASTGENENISTGYVVPGPARYPQAQWSSYGIYITDQFSLSENFLLQAGLRYNHFSIDAEFDTGFYPFPFNAASLSKGALTGSMGFVWRTKAGWVFAVNTATAFRAPNVDDMGKVFDAAPGTVTVPNPDLSAEYAYNGEISVAKVFGDVLKIDLTGYYTWLDNALVRRDFELNGQDSIMYDGTLSKVQAIQNAASAYVYGIQASMEVKLSGGFAISSDINYQKGMEETDNGSCSPTRHAAPVFGTSRLSYRLSKLNMQFYAVYNGQKPFEEMPEEERAKTEIYVKDADGNPFSPSWYTLNFKAIYHFSENMMISTGLENLTDQRYRPYSSGIAAPGRNFILSMRWSF